MHRLTERERITLLMIRGWGAMQRSYKRVRDEFNNHFRNGRTPISKSTVERTIQRFNNTGSVKNLPNIGRPVSVTNEENSLDVLLTFQENPNTSLRRASHALDVSKNSVHRVLKNNKFHPFKVTLVHELNEDDFDRRVEFCDYMMTRINEDPTFISNIAFSDEAIFQLNGNVNRQNCRYWADENPHWMRDSHTQYPQKLNVWAGILNNQIIGPFFIEGTLDGQKYETMLRNDIVPAIQHMTGANFENTWFQQDGAAPHFARSVRDYLDTVFTGRWIGRRGAIEWPARSPDLTPLDFFLWGRLKELVYQTKPQNLVELRERIVNQAALIPAETIQNATRSFYNRLAYCQEVDGHQFEHLL